MRTFAAVLAAGLVAFIGAAIVQEWDFFSTAWFGGPGRPGDAAAADRAAAERALREYLALLRHLHASGGDPRFADRMPASPALVDELLRGIALQQHRGRHEDLELVRLELLGSSEVRGEVEVRTKEYWIVRESAVPGNAPLGARSQLTWATYRVERDGSAWRVRDWQPEPPPEAP